MVGGTELSSAEQGQISVLKQQKLSLRAVAAAVGRFKTAVTNFLKDFDAYSTKKRKRKACKLSERDRRAVFHHATLHKKTSPQVVPLLSQRASARTVRREVRQVQREAEAGAAPCRRLCRLGEDADQRENCLGESYLF